MIVGICILMIGAGCLLLVMVLFAAAEEMRKRGRERELLAMERELWRSGGIVRKAQSCNFSREAVGLSDGAHSPVHAGSIPAPAIYDKKGLPK